MCLMSIIMSITCCELNGNFGAASSIIKWHFMNLPCFHCNGDTFMT